MAPNLPPELTTYYPLSRLPSQQNLHKNPTWSTLEPEELWLPTAWLPRNGPCFSRCFSPTSWLFEKNTKKQKNIKKPKPKVMEFFFGGGNKIDGWLFHLRVAILYFLRFCTGMSCWKCVKKCSVSWLISTYLRDQIHLLLFLDPFKISDWHWCKRKKIQRSDSPKSAAN